MLRHRAARHEGPQPAVDAHGAHVVRDAAAQGLAELQALAGRLVAPDAAVQAAGATAALVVYQSEEVEAVAQAELEADLAEVEVDMVLFHVISICLL